MRYIILWFVSPGQGVPVGAPRSAVGAVHVLGAEEAGLRRGLPLARAVHRLSAHSHHPPRTLESPPKQYFAHATTCDIK